MRAVWNGATIAESDDTVVVEGNHYFPLADVNTDLLVATDTQTTCPWKGTASYFTIVVDGEENVDAMWTYPQPKAGAEMVQDRVAFWKGVEIVD